MKPWLLILVVVAAITLGQALPKGCEDAAKLSATGNSPTVSSVVAAEGEGECWLCLDFGGELVPEPPLTEEAEEGFDPLGWAPGQYLYGVHLGDPFSVVLEIHGQPELTQVRTTRMGLLFCADYSKVCGVHYGVLDSDQSGDLTPDDTVVSAEGRAPYTGEYHGLMVDSFFDVFVEVLGPPNLVLPNTDPGANETWNFWNGVYAVTDNNSPAKTLMIGIGGQTFMQWLHDELATPAASMNM